MSFRIDYLPLQILKFTTDIWRGKSKRFHTADGIGV